MTAKKGLNLLDLAHTASTVLKVLEDRHPASADALPLWLKGPMRMFDGSEAAVRAGVKAFEEGKSDAIPPEEMIALIPEEERKRFTGQTKQLIAAFRAGYLARKTMGQFKGQRPGDPKPPGQPPSNGGQP